MILEVDNKIKTYLEEIDKIEFINTTKVRNAFKNNNVSEFHFNSTTGYGYHDLGREIVEKVYADIFKSEDALVRSQFISGTHALSTTLFGLLRPNDILLSITGKPYDTLDEVIGIRKNESSLKSFGIIYKQIDLKNNDFDYDKIKDNLKDTKVVAIQRSRGYSNRESITIDKLEKIISFIKNINQNTIIMVDNCYCEFVDTKEPIEVNADIAVGSLIKNLGGGIATSGAYVVGKEKLIKLIAERLTAPGCGKEIGPSFNMNRQFLQGLSLAPSVVANSLKTAIFTAYTMEQYGYKVSPKYNEKRADIVQSIIFEDENKLINYCRGIQEGTLIDSNVLLEPSDMAGYEEKIIMASGSFTKGSSIELSCDGPLRKPYTAYQQGGVTYSLGKIGVINAIERILNKKDNN